MKRRVLAMFFALMALCSMTLIFINSAMDSEKSAEFSLGVTRLLYEWRKKPQSQVASTDSVSETSDLPAAGSSEQTKADLNESKKDAEEDRLLQKLDQPVRKAAHAIEYIPLGFSLCGFFLCLLSEKSASTRKCALLALLCVVLYAASDELHQLFVDGRSCQATDVAIDTVGTMVGILLLLCLSTLFRRIRKSA